MKKSILLILTTVLLLACSGKKAYDVHGELGDKTWDGLQVTLFSYSDQAGLKPIDSVRIKDGSFHLKGKVDSLGWYVLQLTKGDQPYYKDFYTEGELVFTIKDGKPVLKGSPVNDAYQTFRDKYDLLTGAILKLNQEIQANPTNQDLQKAFNDEYARFEKSFQALDKKTILENMDNPLGLHLFHTTMSSMNNSDIEAILAKAGPDFMADPAVKLVVLQLASAKKVAVGQKFVDLKMLNDFDRLMSLSDYAGKGSYVLIDFWASWCGPCMRELPALMATYKKYHSKGFEIIGVSLDSDINAWKTAIASNEIPWPQMSDLSGWQSKAVESYSFSGIPYTVLLDPKGVILEKGLRGEALDKKLKELLGQ